MLMIARPVLGEKSGVSSAGFGSSDFNVARCCSASWTLPVATSAIPRAKCHAAVRNTLVAGGAGSARISAHRPNRTLAQ